MIMISIKDVELFCKLLYHFKSASITVANNPSTDNINHDNVCFHKT